MTNPGDTTPEAPQIDPRLILAKIEQRSELGAALVYGASMHVLAEHYAAELGKAREVAADSGSTASDSNTAKT